MSFFTLLSTLLIGPLKLIFEIIYVVANRFIGHPGLSIVVLSLIMNFLVLPLYKRADAMQEASRDIEAKLHDGVAHIKKTFTGDERMMILQAYYRQNNYKPTDALNGSVSLLLEVPFFMAAYQFLSNLQMLQGVSLGPIVDLSAPDAMFIIGGLAINVLPVIMTLVNVISSALYLKGFPAKTKVQLYAMALFFLVFLYNSPSGLVFYWTLNNVFSLAKTIFYKLKNPRKVLRMITSAAGLLVLIFGVFLCGGASETIKVFLITMGVVMQIPLFSSVFKKNVSANSEKKVPQNNRKIFVLGSLFLTIIVGLLIPSTFIAASPQEYVDITYFYNPLWYIVSAFCLAAGTFLVWMGVFYWLASPRGKAIFDRMVWILCGIMVINYMLFGKNLGLISSNLQYENDFYFTNGEQLLNIVVLAAAVLILYFIMVKWGRSLGMVLLTGVVALTSMSALNIYKIADSVSDVEQQAAIIQEKMPSFSLSKGGKNVVVLMLDRALGEFVPYIFNERPELKAQFSGFTFYANTISFGGFTNYGSPPVFGGYEYTPVEMNRRHTEPLVSKHNEALKVMPVLFMENGYDVTVCDPVYANYQWIPDLSIYDEYPEIQTYITQGVFSDTVQKVNEIENNKRNFFCFSVMKAMPLFLQKTIYNDGRYNQADSASGEIASLSTQTASSMSVAEGVYAKFMESFNVLANLPGMTNILDNEENTFLMMTNDITHETMLLQEPDYLPTQWVNNTWYDATHTDRFTVDGKELIIFNSYHMEHYHSNMAAMIQLGNWFDYLRENDLYDNTRIILVSDHGRDLGILRELVFGNGENMLKDAEFYYPLLMVKDFNSNGFTVAYDFMTNADVPTLATHGVIKNPQNPFTGKPIDSSEKTAHDQFIIMTWEWDLQNVNGNTFLPSMWASVKDDLWNEDNWEFYESELILMEHAAP